MDHAESAVTTQKMGQSIHPSIPSVARNGMAWHTSKNSISTSIHLCIYYLSARSLARSLTHPTRACLLPLQSVPSLFFGGTLVCSCTNPASISARQNQRNVLFLLSRSWHRSSWITLEALELLEESDDHVARLKQSEVFYRCGL